MTRYCSAVQRHEFHPDTIAFFTGRTVAVTGGSGFIGSHVVEQLVALGAYPIVVARNPATPFLDAIRGKCEFRPCDLSHAEQTLSALQGASAVLNLAAQVAGLEYNAAHPASIFQANLTSFMNVISASAKLKVERFLVTSSACVYPRHCTIPTSESEGFSGEPEPTNSGYGWAKRMEEYLGQQYAYEYGLSVAIARPYNAYGPRDNFRPESSHVIPALILKAFQAVNGELPVWGDGSHSRSFLYVDDFARGLLEVAARYPRADPVNVGARDETTIAAVAGLIAELVSQARGTKITPVFNPTGLTGQPRRCCDTSKVAALLGFKARVGLQRGLQETVDWFSREASVAPLLAKR